MNKRTLALLFLIALAVRLLLWWRASESGPGSNVPRRESSTPAPTVHKSPAAQEEVSNEDLARTPWNGPDEYKRRMIATVRDSARQANQPIEFYGKVLDQDDNPIAGVKVKIGVRWTQELPLPGTSKDVFNRFELLTDDQGLFVLTNTKGSLLGIDALEKDGYESAPSATRQSYWYWALTADRKYTPDSHLPEIFRMWRKRGAEHLLEKSKSVPMSANGAAVYFDLRTGEKVSSGGDLRVTITRAPQQIGHGQKGFDWTVMASVEDGGLAPTNAEQPYYAPESGYQPTFELHMPAAAPQWAANVTRVFFLKLKDGNYGRITLEFYPGFYEPGVSFHSFINPSGGRNLEYSSLQDVVQPSSPKDQ